MKLNLKNLKSFTSGLLIGTITTLSISIFAVSQLNIVPNPYPVIVNGEETKIDGYNVNNSTYLCLSDTAKALKANAKFNSNKKVIEINSGNLNNSSNSTNIETPKEETNPEICMTSIFSEDQKLEITKYKDYKAVTYNDIIYISSIDLWRINKIQCGGGQHDTLKLYKYTNPKNLKERTFLIQTKDASSNYYIRYNTEIYLNINFIKKYLED